MAFRGRLGFAGPVVSRRLTTSRTCRLANASYDRLRELTAANLEAFDRIVDVLAELRITLYRVSSNTIPFASHPIAAQFDWATEFAETLAALGRRLRALDIRVSMHPGQFTVLNSPRPDVVTAAIAELSYHAQLLDALGAPASSKMVLHLGGAFTDKAAAIESFVRGCDRLPDAVRRRLVIENDDRIFHADEVLGVSRRTGLPVAFDWLHHRANPCGRPAREALADCLATWRPVDGVPKVHLSSQQPDAPSGAHADYVELPDFLQLLEAAGGATFDCMLEAKQKELAVLRLRGELASMGKRGGRIRTGR